MRSRVRRLSGAGSTGVEAVLVTLVVVAVGVVAGAHDEGRAAPPDAARPAAQRLAPGARALAVLRAWDRRRAAAWAAGDPAALRRLYLIGSRTGARDVQALARWRERGLRVTGLRQQVASLAVVARSPGRLVVGMTDRTVDGVAVGGAAGGRRVGLPDGPWRRHRVVLRREGAVWVVAEVWAQPAR